MNGKRIAIACQGGGSQCAFVAGALKALFAQKVQERFRIVGLSGTSGGAFTAALGWLGLLKRAQGDRTPIGDRIIACWKDLPAQTPQEIAFDRIATEMVRLVESGVFPTFASSPSSLRFQMATKATAKLLARPEFTDLRALLVKHIDFAGLPELVHADSPVLLVAAGDVLEGGFKTFSSARGEIKIDALLASAAIPNLFPAVWVDGHAYWDGIFSSNPPIIGFLQKAFMGRRPLPEEIWVIQVNRAQHDTVPETAERHLRSAQPSGRQSEPAARAAADRRRQHADSGGRGDRIASRRAWASTSNKPITVRFIRMSKALQENLDYPSKLSRMPSHIDRLIADGEAQAGTFLDELGSTRRARRS